MRKGEEVKEDEKMKASGGFFSGIFDIGMEEWRSGPPCRFLAYELINLS